MMDNELGQIMNVTIQGMDFTFKATEEILDLMVRFAACLKRNAIAYGKWQIDYTASKKIKREQNLGKKTGKMKRKEFTKREDSNRTAGLRVSYGYYNFLKKNAKKYGIAFSVLPDFLKDGNKHIIFPAEQGNMFKLAQEDYLKKYKRKKEKTEKRQAKAEERRRRREELKNRTYDSELEKIKMEDPVDYIKGQGLDKPSLDEFVNMLLKDADTETSLTKDIEDEIRSLLPEPDITENKSQDRSITDDEFPRMNLNQLYDEMLNKAQREDNIDSPTLNQTENTVSPEVYKSDMLNQEEYSLDRHFEDIIEAVKNNKFNHNLNAPELTYAEIPIEKITADEKDKYNLMLHSAPMTDEDKVIKIPRNNLKKLTEQTYLFAARNDMKFAAEDGAVYSSRNIKKTYGNSDYSDTFIKLFKLDAGKHGKKISDKLQEDNNSVKIFKAAETPKRGGR